MTEQTITETTGGLEANDAGVGGGPGGAPASPEAAQAEIAAIHSAAASDPNHPYNDRRHPEYAALHKHVLGLYDAAMPGAGMVDPDNGYPDLGAPPAPALPATPEAAQTEIDKIYQEARGDPKHPYNDRKHPEHAALHKRMLDLFTAANPDGGFVNDDTMLDLERVESGLEPQNTPEKYVSLLGPARLDPADTPEQITAGRDTAAKWMAELELPSLEVNGLITEYNHAVADPHRHDVALDERRAENSMRALRSIWGDQTETKIAACRRAYERLDRDGRFGDFLEETRLGNSAHMIRILAEAAERHGW